MAGHRSWPRVPFYNGSPLTPSVSTSVSGVFCVSLAEPGADESTQEALKPAGDRKVASNFDLKDAEGNSVSSQH